MSTKGTVKLKVQTFVEWNGQTTAGVDDFCTATARLVNSNKGRIRVKNPDTTDFTIIIEPHGKNTSLEFVLGPGAVADQYQSFIPIGIALKESGDKGIDPVGTTEFRKIKIADNNDGKRTLTLDISSNTNEQVTWNFFLVIQGIPAKGANTGYNIGIIDPKIRGTTA